MFLENINMYFKAPLALVQVRGPAGQHLCGPREINVYRLSPCVLWSFPRYFRSFLLLL